MTSKQSTAETISLPRAILGDPDPSHCFLMEVLDDRMASAGICMGDWLIVREKSRPEPGQPAVVKEDNVAVAKPSREADAPGTTFMGSAIAVLRRF